MASQANSNKYLEMSYHLFFWNYSKKLQRKEYSQSHSMRPLSTWYYNQKKKKKIKKENYRPPGNTNSKESAWMWETWAKSLGLEHPLEEGMATHSRFFAWKIPMDRGGLQSMGLKRVGHDWATKHSTSLRNIDAINPQQSASNPTFNRPYTMMKLDLFKDARILQYWQNSQWHTTLTSWNIYFIWSPWKIRKSILTKFNTHSC